MGKNQDKGNSYEDFVNAVYTAILNAEAQNKKIQTIEIQKKKIIKSADGTNAEIDLYWEYEIAGVKNSVAIECKNHGRTVDISKVRDFADKIANISGLKGLMVTQKKFSEQAIAKANARNIDLLIIRPTQDEDWDGYVRSIHTNFIIDSPVRVTNLVPKLNKKWAQNNGFTNGQSISLNVRNDLLIFEDKSKNFKYSLYELSEKDFFKREELGANRWEYDFEDGWMHTPDGSYKLDNIIIDYFKPEPFREKSVIDYNDYVLAIIKYVNGDTGKFVVLKTGEKKVF